MREYWITGLACCALTLCSIENVTAKDRPVPQVLVIGIGAKNPTFDESKFPHLAFVYTPGLQSTSGHDGSTANSAIAAFAGKMTHEEFSGDPQWLAKWTRKTDLRAHAVLLDKNATGFWEGNISGDDIWECDGNGTEDNLGKAVELTVEKNKVAKKNGSYTAFDLANSDDDEALLSIKIPESEITTVGGQVKPLASILGTAKPVLVVFMQMIPGADITAAKENLNSDDGGIAFKSKAVWGAYQNTIEPLKLIERGFFNTTIDE